MKTGLIKGMVIFLMVILLFSCIMESDKKILTHQFNGNYTGENLNRVAFPIGGIGAGMFCLEGSGAISHMSVRNRPEVYNKPCMFAAISVKDVENGEPFIITVFGIIDIKKVVVSGVEKKLAGIL